MNYNNIHLMMLLIYINLLILVKDSQNGKINVNKVNGLLSWSLVVQNLMYIQLILEKLLSNRKE
jgi:hypothetical protein